MINSAREFGASEVDRAFERLWELFRLRGHGTIAQVERELRLPAKTLHLWRNRQQLRYSDLMAILQCLDEAPGSFFAGLFPQQETSESTHDNTLALPGIVWQAEDLLYEDPLLCLRLLTEQYDGRWETSLAIAKSLKALELWRESEAWIRQAISEAPTAGEQSFSRLFLAPILALPRNNPQAALELVRQCQPLLTGSQLALSYQYESLALRAAGDLAGAAKTAAIALQQPRVSSPTRFAALHLLGLTLNDVGDQRGAIACLRKAYNAFSGTWAKGYSTWALARIAKGKVAEKFYLDALSLFQRSFPFESFKVSLEWFERFGYDKAGAEKLKRVSERSPCLFAAILRDIEQSHQWQRGFDGILRELEGAWNRWLRPQAPSIGAARVS